MFSNKKELFFYNFTSEILFNLPELTFCHQLYSESFNEPINNFYNSILDFWQINYLHKFLQGKKRYLFESPGSNIFTSLIINNCLLRKINS